MNVRSGVERSTFDRLLGEEVVSHDLHIFITDSSLDDLRQILQDQSPTMFGMLDRELLDVMPHIPTHVDQNRGIAVIDQLLRGEEVKPARTNRCIACHALVECSGFVWMLTVVVVE